MVLGGAKELLQEVSFVQFEASLTVYNRGQPCLYELDDFLRRHGFFMYDFGDFNRNLGTFKSGGVGQLDMVYARPQAPHFPEPMKEVKFCGANRNGAPFLDYGRKEEEKAKETVIVPIPQDTVGAASQERNQFACLFLGFLGGYMFANYRARPRNPKRGTFR